MGQIGCTDPLAINFDPFAQSNDGTCIYENTTIQAEVLVNPMPLEFQEQSGMIKFNDMLWIHLDGGNSEDLFTWDFSNNEIDDHFILQNIINSDWEDIAQDESHIYLGDFGNNVGNRTDLRIYKILKSDLMDFNPEDITPELIEFSYPEQTDFSNQNMNHNFDCESMIVMNNEIFIFTKEWESNKTSIYKIPISAGSYNAELIGVLEVNGLVGGADYDPIHNIVLLCGYDLAGGIQPFVFMLWEFQGEDFISANKRRLTIDWDYCQMESITYNELGKWFVGNEYFEIGPIAVNQQLRQIDISEFLTGVIGMEKIDHTFSLFYPNPTSGKIWFSEVYENINIYSIEGKLVQEFSNQRAIETELDEGIYLLKLRKGSAFSIQKMLIQ